jgi:hypothetical protein
MPPTSTAGPKPVKTLLPYSWAVFVWSHARKVVVAVIGGTLLVLGALMLVFPGPGWLTIFAGLGLLATEFAWARWMLKYAKQRLSQLVDAAKDGIGMGTKSDAQSVSRAETSGTGATRPGS